VAASAAFVLAVGVLGAAASLGRLPDGRSRRWLETVSRLAGAVLLMGVGTVSASRVSPARAAQKGSRFAILFTSGWDGAPEVFAADPEGNRPVRQVTFAPSLAAASGLFPSPDGRRFAFLCCQVGSSVGRWGLHVVAADGSTDRVVNSSRTLPLDDTLVWSSDGRHVHLAVPTYGEGPSPNGRWNTHVLTSGCSGFCPGVRTEVETAGGRLVTVLNGVLAQAWSPDSRLLAYATDDGISLLDPRSGTTRLLSHDVGSGLAWSPDGRLLAYTQRAGYAAPGDLRTVALDGRVRVVVAANGRYGGPIFAFAWTRVPKGVRYRAPSPVTGVFTGWTVTALAADGGHVAYATCAGVFSWNTAAAEPTQAAKSMLDDNCSNPSHESVSSIALAGDRLVYVHAQGGNTTFWSVVGVSLGTTPPLPIVLAKGSNTSGPPRPGVAGSGELLAVATRDINTTTAPPSLFWHIQTVGQTGCPCQEILRFADPHQDGHLDDVDDGRLVVSGGGLVRILNPDGSLLLTLPLEPLHAALSGDDLVVQLDGELRDYSATTGMLLHSWPLAASTQQALGSALQDVARGLAVYTADGQLHLLRLSDGSDTIIGAADLARFADSGLVVAAGTRIQLVAYGKLPLN
jgi:WD40 repeat protein